MISNTIRRIQKRIEAIPTPGAIIYNAIVKKMLSKQELEFAKEILQKIKEGVLIDIGSGTGFLSIGIAKNAPNLKVYGIDLSKKMIEIASANAKNLKNIRFKHANAENLPFRDESVDLIVSTGSFHHWKHPIKVYNECYRVLKKNAEAWIYDGCSDLPSEYVHKLIRRYGFFKYRYFNQVARMHGFPWNEYQTNIKSMLTKTKFKNNFKMKLMNNWMKISLTKV